QRVVLGQHAERTREPHEVHEHGCGRIGVDVERLDFARGEGQAGVGAESCDLPAGIREFAHGRTIGKEPLEHAHGLKEPEGIRVLAQCLRQRRLRYSSVFHPALGGHTRIVAFRCLVRAASIEKLFTDAYSPKNRSSTDAKRYTPLPANCSSSKLRSTRRPRAKLTP